MNKLILILLLTIGQLAAMAQEENAFNPVDSTGLPYSIIITGVSLNGSILTDSAEIAVFDDTLCVGTIKYENNGNLQLVAWRGDASQSLPGFTLGHTMSFKARLFFSSAYYIEEAIPTYSNGDGSFGYGTFSVLSLAISSTIVSIEEALKNDELLISPNPFVSNITIDTRGKNYQKIEFFDLQGKMLYRENLQNEITKIHFPAGQIFTDKTNCMVIAKIFSSDKTIIRKLLYVGKP